MGSIVFERIPSKLVLRVGGDANEGDVRISSSSLRSKCCCGMYKRYYGRLCITLSISLNWGAVDTRENLGISRSIGTSAEICVNE